jgi:hypothetical protein
VKVVAPPARRLPALQEIVADGMLRAGRKTGQWH